MPRGEGTYGSAVGRPPENKKSPIELEGDYSNDLNNNMIKDEDEPKGVETVADPSERKTVALMKSEYAPFKMKAAGFGNSPMLKNFGVGGSPAKFGFGGSMPRGVSAVQQEQEDALQQSMSQANLQKPVASTEEGGGGGFGGFMDKLKSMFSGGVGGGDGGGDAPVTPESNRQKIEQLREAISGDTGGVKVKNKPIGGGGHFGEILAAGGGGGGEAPWEAMGSGEFSDMSKKDARSYMQGLTKGQKHQQFASNIKGGMGGLSAMGGFGGWMSDIRLKEKIQRTGASPSGIPIYEFNYIGDNNRYSGAMAQDLLEMNIDAVSMDASGYYKVNYNNIDVDMHLIN